MFVLRNPDGAENATEKELKSGNDLLLNPGNLISIGAQARKKLMHGLMKIPIIISL